MKRTVKGIFQDEKTQEVAQFVAAGIENYADLEYEVSEMANAKANSAIEAIGRLVDILAEKGLLDESDVCEVASRYPESYKFSKK